MFSTSTDGQVLWWDIRKLVEPVETLPLEFAAYKPGLKLGGIVVEYESTMVGRDRSSSVPLLLHPFFTFLSPYLLYPLLPPSLPLLPSPPSSWSAQSKGSSCPATERPRLLRRRSPQPSPGTMARSMPCRSVAHAHNYMYIHKKMYVDSIHTSYVEYTTTYTRVWTQYLMCIAT